MERNETKKEDRKKEETGIQRGGNRERQSERDRDIEREPESQRESKKKVVFYSVQSRSRCCKDTRKGSRSFFSFIFLRFLII